MPAIAVIDLETTGLFPSRHHRVLELAVVMVQPNGSVVDEYVTLINPGRDIGETSIHGISAAEVMHAPAFSDIAGDLVDRLRNASAIAAHNARFDVGFLDSEFGRIGYDWPGMITAICTMSLASQLDSYSGRKLIDCCDSFGIDGPDEAHTALSDARATARLLTACLATAGDRLHDPPWHSDRLIEWPTIPAGNVQCVTRDRAQAIIESAPSFLDRAAGRLSGYAVNDTQDTLEYLDLLDRCLEDRRLEEIEAETLLETARKWGLSLDKVRVSHQAYIEQLAVAALADGVLTEAERSDLDTVARLLGEEAEFVDESLSAAKQQIEMVPSPPSDQRSELKGLSVCFTGALIGCVNGKVLTREQAQLLAAAAGLKVATSVTKKLDLLVVADPHTQSGKAKKARKYGTRIMAEPVFWNSVGAAVD